MRTRIFSAILALCITVVSFTGCTKGVSQEQYDKVVSEKDKLASELAAIGNVGQSEAPTSGIPTKQDVSVKDEPTTDDIAVTTYTLHGRLYSYLIFVLKNNSKETLAVSLDTTFKDANGKLVGAKKTSASAFASGTEILLYTMCDEKFEAFDYEISSKNDSNYLPVTQFLKYETSTTKEKCVVSVTNSGEIAAGYVECSVLFFKGDTVVGHDSGYATDADQELKPQKTKNVELSCYEPFDSVKVYFAGRGRN